MNRYLGITLGSIFALLVGITGAWPDATLLPNGLQWFMDRNGKPLANGKVFFYQPGTTTTKTVWTDSTEATPQAQPVPLGISGWPANPIYGDGSYRQIVKDQFNNTIWDFNTASTGGGSSGGGGVFSEGVMVGTVIFWANTTLPNHYLYTAGQAISRATYPALLTALTFNASILCTSGVASIAVSTDISDKVPIGAPVEFSCFAPGTTVSSKTSGLLTLSSNATTTASVNGNIFPWGNGDGSTTFNVPDYRGRVPVGRNNMNGTASSVLTSTYWQTPGGSPVNPNALNSIAGSQSHTLIVGELPANITSGGSTSVTLCPLGNCSLNFPVTLGGTITNEVVSSSGALNVPKSTAGNWQATNQIQGTVSITVTSNNTAGNPHTVMQPGTTSDYIIKALPDDLPSGPGVTSLGGMTGNIACGGGITCNANIISGVGFAVQPANLIFAGPTSGVPANPAFRALVPADIAGSAASHAVPVDVAGVPTWKVLPDCQDSGGNHINYTQSTDTFSCGNTSSGGGGGGSGYITSTATVTGATTTYVVGQANALVLRANSGSNMVDTLPGSSPGILPSGTLFAVENNDTAGIIAIKAGSGATLKAIIPFTGYIYLCPKQSITFYSDGTNYWAINQPAACKVQANLVLYGATTGGSSTNTGLDSSSPLDNLTNAYKLAQLAFNANQQVVRLQAVTSGTISAQDRFDGPISGQAPIDGQGGLFPVVIQGDTATLTNFKYNITGADAIYVTGGANLLIQGFEFNVGTSGNCIDASGPATKISIKLVRFDGCATNSILATHRAFIEIVGNYDLNGNGQGHITVSDGGSIYYQAATAVNYVSNSTFSSCFACAQYSGSNIVCNATPTFVGGGGAFGPKYSVFLNAMVNTGTGNVNFFPGSVAGSTTTGGQYN